MKISFLYMKRRPGYPWKDEHQSEMTPDRLAVLAKSTVSLGLGAWALALGVGASHVLSEILFPPRDLEAVEAQPADLRDSPAPLLPRYTALPPASQSREAEAAFQPVAAPGPDHPPVRDAGARDGSSGSGSRRVSAAFSDGLLASAGPAQWGAAPEGGGAAAAIVPPSVAATRTAEPPAAAPRAAGRERRGGGAAPAASGRGEDRIEGRGEAQAEAYAAPANAAPARRTLEAFPAASRNRLLLDPGAVQRAGGRVGQGSISMEEGSGITLRDIDPRAKGLGNVPGKTPPGPVLRAGDAPAIPSSHVPLIIAAAANAGVDAALLAATAARESHFGEEAYRAEPHLKQVLWGRAPGTPKEKYFDGSIGPTQVLRSNFIARGIDNDREAYDLENNYSVSASIIHGNLRAFPGDEWKGVAAYNVGQYGARIGRVPANNYVATILAWRKAYAAALKPYE